MIKALVHYIKIPNDTEKLRAPVTKTAINEQRYQTELVTKT